MVYHDVPKRPLRPCTNPACIVLHDEGGRCAKCSRKLRKQQDSERGSAAERGYGWRWQKYLQWFWRQPENQLCANCEASGEWIEATLVHHIVATGKDDPLFWEPTNHQALCRRCHEVKHGRMRE